MAIFWQYSTKTVEAQRISFPTLHERTDIICRTFYHLVSCSITVDRFFANHHIGTELRLLLLVEETS